MNRQCSNLLRTFHIAQASLVTELRSETAALEAALSVERLRVEKLLLDMAKMDAKMLDQGEATVERMTEMAKRVSTI